MSFIKNFTNSPVKSGMKLGNSTKIVISWGILVAAGIYSFYLSRTNVIEKRVEHMKIRERMYSSNTGEYEPGSRYTRSS